MKKTIFLLVFFMSLSTVSFAEKSNFSCSGDDVGSLFVTLTGLNLKTDRVLLITSLETRECVHDPAGSVVCRLKAACSGGSVSLVYHGYDCNQLDYTVSAAFVKDIPEDRATLDYNLLMGLAGILAGGLVMFALIWNT